MGTESCINRPNKHWQRRSEWQRETILKSWENKFLPTTLHQCGKVWKTSPTTRHHPPALWKIHNWQTICYIFFSFIAGLKKVSHPTPILTFSSMDPLKPPATPSPPSCTSDQWRWCAPGLQEAEEKASTRPRLCYTSLSEILCWPAGPHLHTDHWSCAKSLPALNAPPSSPFQRNPKLQDWMTTVLWL